MNFFNKACCTKGVPGESIYKGQLNSSSHASPLSSSPVSQTVYFSRTSKVPSRRKASTCPSRWTACRKTAALRHFHHCLIEIKLNRGPLVALADLCAEGRRMVCTPREHPDVFQELQTNFASKKRDEKNSSISDIISPPKSHTAMFCRVLHMIRSELK